VEQIAEHADAALLDLGRPRVLRVVDEVAVQVLGDQLPGLGLHPRGDERRQVAFGNPLGDQVLGDQPLRRERAHWRLREGPVGDRFDDPPVLLEPLGRQCLTVHGGDRSLGARFDLHPEWVNLTVARRRESPDPGEDRVRGKDYRCSRRWSPLPALTGAPTERRARERSVRVRGAGRVVFAATMLLIVGFLNIIYGIGALDDANIFVNDSRFVLDNLSTLGWVLIILGVIQLTGGFSLFAGNTYGRVLGIVGGSLGAIGALLSIGGAFPWWSLAIFFLCVYIVHGIIVFGEDERAAERVTGV
jgi:hypothetical protein